jgi:hypothetical protein
MRLSLPSISAFPPFRSFLLLGMAVAWALPAQAQVSRALIEQVFEESFRPEATKATGDTTLSVYRTPIRGMQLYGHRAKMFGQVMVSRNELKGKGLISVEGSLVRCDEAHFTAERIECPNGKFIVKSSNPSKPVLEVDDVMIDYLLDRQIAVVRPLGEEERIKFPNHHYELGFHEFTWPFNQQNIHVESVLDTLGNPYPIHVRSTSLRHAGLAFEGTSFDYQFDQEQITMGGVKEIPLSHIVALPADGRVVIKADGTLDTLRQAKVRFNTDQKHMSALSEGDLVIDSKHHFSGVGTYEFVNYKGERYQMVIQDIAMRTYNTTNGSHQEEVHEAAVAATVEDGKPLELIPGMLFAGKLKLSTHRRDFDFDGKVSVNLEGRNHFWIDYSGTGGHRIRVPDNVAAPDGSPLRSGLYLDGAGNLHTLFMEPNRLAGAFAVSEGTGFISFNPDDGFYTLENQISTKLHYKEHHFAYHPGNKSSRFGGVVHLNESTREIQVSASAVGDFDAQKQRLGMNAVIELQLRANRKPFETIAASFQGFQGIGATSGLEDLYYNLAHFMPAQDLAILKNTPPEEWNLLSFFVGSMVFNAHLEWSKEHRAFYSQGLVGISNFFKSQVNAQVDGFVYIPMASGRQELHLYLKGKDHWYYFQRQGDQMRVCSSNQAINEYYQSKEPGMPFLPEEEVQEMIESFQSRFRKP